MNSPQIQYISELIHRKYENSFPADAFTNMTEIYQWHKWACWNIPGGVVDTEKKTGTAEENKRYSGENE